MTDAGSEVTFGSQLPAAARHFATSWGREKSAVFAALWHAGRVAARGHLFRFKVAVERIFVVADSIQSLLDLFDIKPCLARSAVGRDRSLPTRSFGLGRVTDE